MYKVVTMLKQINNKENKRSNKLKKHNIVLMTMKTYVALLKILNNNPNIHTSFMVMIHHCRITLDNPPTQNNILVEAP